MGSIHNRIMEGHILDTLRCKKLTISRFWYLNYCNVIKRFSPYFVFVCYLFQLSNLKNSFTHQLLMPLEGKLTTALNLFSLLIFKNATLLYNHQLTLYTGFEYTPNNCTPQLKQVKTRNVFYF